MRYTHILAAMLLLFLCSCQKELHYMLDDVKTPHTDSVQYDGTLLIRLSSINSKNDSVVTTFNYNNNKQLLSIITTGKDGSTAYNQATQLARDAKGFLTAVKTTAAFETVLPGAYAGGLQHTTGVTLPAGNATVPVIIKLHYAIPDSVFDYSIQTFSFSGVSAKDSVVYTYTGKHITLATLYFSATYNGSAAIAYQKIAATSYSYDNFNNLTGSDTKAVNQKGGSLQEAYKYTFGYTSNTNPLKLGNEALLYGDQFRNALNSCIKQLYVNATAVNPLQISRAIAFNNNNMPATAVLFNSGVNQTYKETYYYK